MFEHALTALEALFDPTRLTALFAGMLVGMVFGMLPGLGGVAAVSILLPFVFYLDDYSGLAMLLGAISIVYTSDTITSVLLGAPGSPASAPTAIEGHALAKQGHAARALGVGFLASMVGGLMGAAILLVAIPIAGPIVLMLSTPELFMFALVGLFFASSMVGKDLAKGLAAASLGVLLGVVGPAQAAADFRFTFGQVYLLDGFSLTIVALGLFGVAEAISMLAAGGGISHEPMKVSKWGAGFPRCRKARRGNICDPGGQPWHRPHSCRRCDGDVRLRDMGDVHLQSGVPSHAGTCHRAWTSARPLAAIQRIPRIPERLRSGRRRTLGAGRLSRIHRRRLGGRHQRSDLDPHRLDASGASQDAVVDLPHLWCRGIRYRQAPFRPPAR
nr:tripartite tricarboxylate transporter permease [Jannaschia helgolandensis]